MRRRSYVRVNLDKNLWWRRIAEEVNETDSTFWPTDSEGPMLPLSRNERLLSEACFSAWSKLACPSLNSQRARPRSSGSGWPAPLPTQLLVRRCRAARTPSLRPPPARSHGACPNRPVAVTRPESPRAVRSRWGGPASGREVPRTASRDRRRARGRPVGRCRTRGPRPAG